MASLEEDKNLLLKAVRNFTIADQMWPVDVITGDEFGVYLDKSASQFTPQYFQKIDEAAQRYFGSGRVITKKEWQIANSSHDGGFKEDIKAALKMVKNLGEDLKDSQKNLPPEIKEVLKIFKSEGRLRDPANQLIRKL